MTRLTTSRNTRCVALFAIMALALVACSEAPRGKIEGEIALSIDRKATMFEKFSKTEALEKHTELLDVFETACQAVFFLETKSSSEGKSSVVNLAEISITDNILTCQSGRLKRTGDDSDVLGGFSGCSLRARGEGDIQIQYLLALRDYLRDRHKMEEDAVLHSILKESSDRASRDRMQLYSVKQNTLTCRDMSAATEVR